jgi:hypothetical protein
MHSGVNISTDSRYPEWVLNRSDLSVPRSRPIATTRSVPVVTAGRRYRRLLARVSTLAGLVGVSLLAASGTALADGVNVDQIAPSKPLGTVNAILIFGVAPVATLAILTLIFLRPGSAPGSQRYRPGRGWHAEPTWVGVPAREHHSEHTLEGADVLGEQAEEFVHHHDVAEIEPKSPTDPNATRRQGGAHGAWCGFRPA